ncbi:hypothetical protein ACLB2K_035267 [Fragaria x ananassa]
MAAISISMASKTATASAASVTASLISKLSLSNQEEPVDLGNLWCPKSGFVAQRFYLVGRLNTTRAIVFDAFRSAVRSMWKCRLEKIDIRSVPLDSVPAALSTAATTRLVAETIGVVLQVDHGGFQRGLARVRVTLPLN